MAGPIKDHYRVLGVKPLSSLEEIHKNYRMLAKKYHPDVSTEKLLAEEKMKEISEAYNVLKDNEKRKIYDVGRHFQFRPYRKTHAKAGEKKQGFFASLFNPAPKDARKKDAAAGPAKKNPVESSYTMGLTYAAMRKPDSLDYARHEFMTVVKLDPKNADALYNLGLTHYLTGEYDEAVMCFKKVLAMDASNPDTRVIIGMLIVDRES